MTDLNLELPPEKSASSSGVFYRTLVLLLLVGTLAGVWYPKPATQVVPVSSDKATVAYDEDLFIRLKKLGADREAAEMLLSATLNPKLSQDRKAYYFLEAGKLFASAGESGKALEAWVKAGQLVTDESKDLSRKITAEIVRELRRQGRHSAASSELSRRNRALAGKEEIKEDEETVVATINNIPYTRRQVERALDRQIEMETAMQLNQAGSDANPGQIREQVRAKYDDPNERNRFLQEWVSQEVLTLEADKHGLDSHPEYISRIDQARRNILINLLINEKVQPKITRAEVDNYIKANPADFGLSTDAGEISAETLDQLRPEAEQKWTEFKASELQQQFQQSLQERYEVDIKPENFRKN